MIVASGQLLSFTGFRNSRAEDVALATSFSPAAGVLFAFLLLSEREYPPSQAH